MKKLKKCGSQEEVSIAGLKVHKHKALEILQKPTGCTEFIACLNNAIHQLSSVGDHNSRPLKVDALISYFELSETGTVVIKETFLKQLENSNKKFAKSETAKKVHELATMIIAKCEDPVIMKVLKHYPGGVGLFINSLFDNYEGKPPDFRSETPIFLGVK